ncbi:hypothetical protein [Schumannella soli]|uniref:Uncharacterized protein n=1 Tax=Schumannella soli TaxID=2590779 RepID=A0A506XSM6_9MICO|nr:hypothetical protein [Schumannella soli]TPW75661.1 hypothetical protein FJ657_07200 [Schumannella soli]
MFIEGKYGILWNLAVVAGFKRKRNGSIDLYFPVAGGNLTVGTSHPQYRQIDQFLRQHTIGADQPS